MSAETATPQPLLQPLWLSLFFEMHKVVGGTGERGIFWFSFISLSKADP